jgi:sphinganine-1-phosphate aldolase
VRAEGLIESVSAKYLNIVHYLYNLILTTPQAKRKLKKQLDASRIELKQKLITDKEDKVQMLAKHAQLPVNGQTRDQLTGMLNELDKIHKVDYESGKVRWVPCCNGTALLF